MRKTQTNLEANGTTWERHKLQFVIFQHHLLDIHRAYDHVPVSTFPAHLSGKSWTTLRHDERRCLTLSCRCPLLDVDTEDDNPNKFKAPGVTLVLLLPKLLEITMHSWLGAWVTLPVLGHITGAAVGTWAVTEIGASTRWRQWQLRDAGAMEEFLPWQFYGCL